VGGAGGQSPGVAAASWTAAQGPGNAADPIKRFASGVCRKAASMYAAFFCTGFDMAPLKIRCDAPI
jgi:hypothetical protein